MIILANKTWTKILNRKCASVVFVGALTGVASAEGMVSNWAKKFAPHEALLSKTCIGLVIAFLALIAWEILEGKRASRSSLDIAKLAAAAAKKKTSAGAPASGSVPSQSATPAGRSFAPPPPPPPPVQQETAPSSSRSGLGAPPPPPPSGVNPFSAETASPSAAAPPSSPVGGVEPVDSKVAFTPPDAGSSGGWADLLQRVRAGEPEAGSFEENAPPPSTEGEGVSPFESTSARNAPAASPPSFSMGGESPSEPSAASSSEAWEALLKRTTGTGEGPGASPSRDSDRITLGGKPPSVPPSMGGGPGVGAPPASSGFSLPSLAAESSPAPEAGSGFKLPPAGTSPPAPTSPFSLPSSSPTEPSFQLPGSVPSQPAASAFQLPGQPSPNPFEAAAGRADDPSGTMPLTDMFSGGGGAAPPSFQLPSAGGQQPSGGNPFDLSGSSSLGFDPGAGRTISLDFSQSSGQVPPPPQPKTEG